MFDSFEGYWLEFLTIAGVHILAVASPGPDFAVVLKHSIKHGRRAAIITSIGVGVGILVHVTYSLMGIGILIKTTPGLFQAISVIAATYLLYLGLIAIRSQPPQPTTEKQEASPEASITDRKAFSVGLLTNGLNPKATLFFLSVFAVAVSASTPNAVKLIYGLYLTLATALWVCMLSVVLSSQRVRTFIGNKGYWFDRVMGLVLILLAIKLLIPS
jgi:RhtB (resistance to homoserine/threonine) family protein